MECDEQSLRELLCSPLSARAAAYLLGEVGRGTTLKIVMLNGEEIHLSDLESAVLALKERFGWNPNGPPTATRPTKRNRRKEKAFEYVLGLCQTFGQDFTMKDVVARVINERPDVMLQFSSIWSELVRSKVIKVKTAGEPDTFEVSTSPGELRLDAVVVGCRVAASPTA